MDINHSIPIYSAFCDNPEAYHINIKRGYSRDEIKEVNKKYLESIEGEVTKCQDKKLIISGEDISVLSIDNLISLKRYFKSICSSSLKIKVIIYVRNPITWAASAIQENIKQGGEYEISFRKVEEKLKSLYSERTGKFVSVFGKKNVNIYCFENAIKYEFGLMGHFLSILGFNDKEICDFKVYKANESMSQISADILSYINSKIPLIKDGKVNEGRSVVDFVPFLDIKGSKFDIPHCDKVKLIETCKNDITWLKDNCNIDYSGLTYIEESNINTDLDKEIIINIIKTYKQLYPIMKELVKEYFQIQLKCSSNSNNSLQLKHLLDEFYKEEIGYSKREVDFVDN